MGAGTWWRWGPACGKEDRLMASAWIGGFRLRERDGISSTQCRKPWFCFLPRFTFFDVGGTYVHQQLFLRHRDQLPTLWSLEGSRLGTDDPIGRPKERFSREGFANISSGSWICRLKSSRLGQTQARRLFVTRMQMDMESGVDTRPSSSHWTLNQK